MATNTYPKLLFKYPFDDAAAFEAEARGYLAYALVETEDGSQYSVVFYDPIRLRQDLEVETGEGKAFIAEPGLIVIPDVTLSRMQEAVAQLEKEGYFNSLKKIEKNKNQITISTPLFEAGVGIENSGHSAEYTK